MNNVLHPSLQLMCQREMGQRAGRSMACVVFTILIAPLIALFIAVSAPQANAADNVLIVTLDGLRWQEVFGGVDTYLLETESNAQTRQSILAKFDATSREAKRQQLMPFLWSEVAKNGVLIGDHSQQSYMHLTNQWWFSYPGYNEILTGQADDRIDSNAAEYNNNVTILEYLHNDGLNVAAFAGWDVFPYIINTQRNSFTVNAGFTPVNWESPSQKAQWLSELQTQVPSPWTNVGLDAFTFGFAKAYIEQHQPQVIYVALGETDDFAHDGEYVQYLNAAHRSDDFIRQLWNTLQSMPQYKDNTNLLITVDHGRGVTQADWQHHASPDAVNTYMKNLKSEFPDGIKGADEVWFAAMGPDIAPIGLFKTEANTQANTQTDTQVIDAEHNDKSSGVTTAQFAATVLTSLGRDYREFNPDIAPPINAIFKQAITLVNTNNTLTRIGFGSCLKEYKPQPLWSKVNAKSPDLFILTGDNVYGDTEDMAVLEAKYDMLAAQPGFAALRRRTPVVGIWDDHDYGENDAGKAYPKKAQSKQIMLNFFAEPENSVRRTQSDGAYTSYMFGEAGKTVHIIMPDLRYNRDPIKQVSKLAQMTQRYPNDMGPYAPSDDPTATMLGENQWQWLEAELAKPADIKILVSSLQVIADFTGWEAWANFPYDQNRLYSLIDDLSLDNLIMISGDTHWAELSTRTFNETTLIDLTSSGMTEEWKQISPNQYRQGEAYAQANYGWIEIDWDATPVSVNLSINTIDEVLIEHQVVMPH